MTVTVLAVQGDKVKIGILAPAEVPVHRLEIQDRIEGCCTGSGSRRVFVGLHRFAGRAHTNPSNADLYLNVQMPVDRRLLFSELATASA